VKVNFLAVYLFKRWHIFQMAVKGKEADKIIQDAAHQHNHPILEYSGALHLNEIPLF